ncbi:MAG: hypothetical protein M3R71_01110 [Actinomycetota bacterium]|nr:hypothetical protein [Actinomycetota bacterium]
MRELHARLLVEGMTDEETKLLPVQLDTAMISRMEISTWRTDAGDLDVLADMPARDGRRLHYEDLADGAEVIDAPGFSIRAAGLSEIMSKEWADRPKDHEALDELRTIRAARADAEGEPVTRAKPAERSRPVQE